MSAIGSAGASCAPVPGRPHAAVHLSRARAGRAPPFPVAGPQSVPAASAWRPPRALPRRTAAFPRHPRGAKRPRILQPALIF